MRYVSGDGAYRSLCEIGEEKIREHCKVVKDMLNEVRMDMGKII